MGRCTSGMDQSKVLAKTKPAVAETALYPQRVARLWLQCKKGIATHREKTTPDCPSRPHGPQHHRHFCSRPGWVAGSRAPGRRDAQRQASSFGARPAAGEGARGGELAAVAGWREEAPRIGDAQSLPRQPLAESKNLTAGSTAGSG
jgi:hypothetical protein